jgi:hypothetical protein
MTFPTARGRHVTAYVTAWRAGCGPAAVTGPVTGELCAQEAAVTGPRGHSPGWHRRVLHAGYGLAGPAARTGRPATPPAWARAR